MIEKLIIDTLKDLNIPIYLDECDGSDDEYIVFSIYNAEDSDFVDDVNLSETYYMTVNYWCGSLKNLNKYKEIKNKLKSNGFTFDTWNNISKNGKKGKSLDFIFENYDI